MNRLRRMLAFIFGGAALLALGWWAGSVAFSPPEDPLSDPEPVMYEVGLGTVERATSVTATAEWIVEDMARNRVAGTLTSIEIVSGAEVGSGDILFRVNLRPVVLAQGVVPMSRDLGMGDTGADVAQLQQLLSDLGHYQGEVEGVFTLEVRTAVRDWQNALGVRVDGIVRIGDIIFAPNLPARVLLPDELKVGNILGGGEMVLRRVLERTVFYVTLTASQRDSIPATADIRIDYGSGIWTARAGDVEDNPMLGEVRVYLEAPGGGPVCGQACETNLPVLGSTRFPATIVLIPETTGPVVPLAALMSLPDGSLVVTDAAGGEIPVTVVAAHAGLAVVEGLSPGRVILLPLSDQR